MSKFKEDLRKEKILSQFLDTSYSSLNLQFERIADRGKQYRGIDLTYFQNGVTVNIDVTIAKVRAKELQTSFFLYYLYQSIKSINE